MSRLVHRKVAAVDTVIIGGGAAGLMASIVAAEAGAKVVVLEKNATLGNKLRITGGGRCNITNNTTNVRTLLSAYKDAGKFLFSPFAQFGVPETRQWLREHGIDTIEEAQQRVFPVSQKAVVVTETLIAKATAAGVEFVVASPVSLVTRRESTFMVTTPKTIWQAKRVVLATGGTSRPETGSSGDAWPWLTDLGHTIITPSVALVPLVVHEKAIVAKLAGVSLALAGITVLGQDAVVSKQKGKVLFTHVGLSGPGILNISSVVKEALVHGVVTVALDLLPTTPVDVLEEKILGLCMSSPNKLVRNQLSHVLPTALVALVMQQAAVPADLPGHSLTVEARRRLVRSCKGVTFSIAGLLGADKAIVTRGGVALTEVDFRTMESKQCPGLYVIGDVLDIDRPSGGYSLQLCWTTGYVAGKQIALKQAGASQSD
ncbi:MAG: hypothetical protein RLZZ70_846 [Candidatus Parcubacteria bacterium]|jgi:predicted Rossmann fold flavoprotein